MNIVCYYDLSDDLEYLCFCKGYSSYSGYVNLFLADSKFEFCWAWCSDVGYM